MRLRLWALATVALPRLAYAQGGDPVGPGMWWLILKVWAIGAFFLGTIMTFGLMIMLRNRPRKPPIGRAILAAYGWAIVVMFGASLAALFAESWWVLGVLAVVGVALFLSVVHRLWRHY